MPTPLSSSCRLLPSPCCRPAMQLHHLPSPRCNGSISVVLSWFVPVSEGLLESDWVSKATTHHPTRTCLRVVGSEMASLPAEQVFRTFNASVTLDRLLHEEGAAARAGDPRRTVDAKKADYEVANKEARPLPRGHCPGAACGNVSPVSNSLRLLVETLATPEGAPPPAQAGKHVENSPGRVAPSPIPMCVCRSAQAGCQQAASSPL